MNNSSNQSRRWFIFLFKAYIIAVPVVVLICQSFVVEILPFHISNLQAGSQHLQSQIIERESVKFFRTIEFGYIFSLVILLADAVIAAKTQNKREFRSALIFASLNIISMFLFFPFSLTVPTR
jgi:uncharacterized Tic20 family protein